MVKSDKSIKKSGRKRTKKKDAALYGLEYHGVTGCSHECQEAVMRLLQCRVPIDHVRIISAGNRHSLLLTNSIGDQIAIKSGFTSGYGGSGPVCFSITLQFLHSHKIDMDEYIVDESFIDRLDNSAFTIADIENIRNSNPVPPRRLFEYILERDLERSLDGNLWQEFPPIIPFSLVDSRMLDLARDFWANPDGVLLSGYRRLEDIVRERTGFTESSQKLFSRAFTGKDPALVWPVKDESEKNGRANLFTGTYMAYRNPRAHRENLSTELLSEFLLLNHLYRLEREAEKVEPQDADSELNVIEPM